MPIRPNVHSGECQFWKIVLWGNVHSAKCTFWKVYVQGNAISGKCTFREMYILASVRSGKYTFGIMYFWPSVFRGNVLSGKCFSWRCTGSISREHLMQVAIWFSFTVIVKRSITNLHHRQTISFGFAKLCAVFFTPKVALKLLKIFKKLKMRLVLSCPSSMNQVNGLFFFLI